MTDRSKDWFVQAEHDLEQAKSSQKEGRHEWACFAAQQSADKAVKALHLSRAHPQMALCDAFGVGRRDLNPRNSALFLRFKSCTRLEGAPNSSSVDGHKL